ncbi:MAG: DNA recombination protein RmuC [Planctomycetaceae bacterium]|nr:DNA recombination protein RmuC [Planctomycetaceae bacterium]
MAYVFISALCVIFGTLAGLVFGLRLAASWNEIHQKDTLTISEIEKRYISQSIYAELKQNFDVLQNSESTRIADISRLTEANQNLEHNNSQLSEERIDLQKFIEQKYAEIKSQTAEISRLTAELSRLTEANQNLEQNNSLLSAERINLQKSIEQRDAEIKSQTAEISRLTEENKYRQEKEMEREKEFAAILQQVHDKMQADFEIFAHKIFEEHSKRFGETNQKELATIVDPLKEKIAEFDKQVKEAYYTEGQERAGLKKQLEYIIEMNTKMTDEAKKLTTALAGNSKTQGDWGEFQLEKILEASGLQEGTHYRKQVNFKTDDGANVRPDYVIDLPEDRHYVVDSKVSLTAYTRYCDTDDKKQQETALAEHIVSIKRHIDELSKKSYHNLDINTLDFVFLFVPVEPALYLALQHQPTLFNDAINKKVCLVSVSTLLATLKTITFIWLQENQKRNVFEIAKEAGNLYDKFVGFIKDLETVGDKIRDAQKSYEDAFNKLSRSSQRGTTIIGRIENLKRLGANATKQIDQKLLEQQTDE